MVGRFVSCGVLEEKQLTVESNFRETELLFKKKYENVDSAKILSLCFWMDL